MPVTYQKVEKKERGIWLLDNGLYLVDFRPNEFINKRFRKTFSKLAECRQYMSFVTDKLREDEAWKPQKKADVDNRRLDALVEDWFKYHGSALDDGVRQKNKMLIMSDIMGNPIARKIDKEDLTEYRTMRLASQIKPKTVNNEHGYLVALFNTLIKLGKWKGDNKVAGMSKIKLDESELTYLEPNEIEDLLNALDEAGHHRTRFVVEICLSTGARWSEVLNLHSRHIKSDKIQYVNTKNGSTRWVTLEVGLIKRLKALGDGYVFEQKRCERQFKAGIVNANISLPEGQLTHVLRHTFATWYLANGGDIKVLQATLGHKRLQSTEVYLKVVSAMKANVVELNPLSRLREQQDRRALKLVSKA